jgi:pilus assembly protein TadC
VTGRLLAAGCLVGAAALVATAPRIARRRLRALRPAPVRPRPAVPPRAVAVLCAVSVAVLLGDWAGLVLAVPVGVAVERGLRRVEPRSARAERLRAAADLPLAADLLAAALRAGAPVDRAAGAVGAALGGPLGERLLRVSRALRLGATAEEAWRHVAELSVGGAAGQPAGFDRLAAAAVRSASSGAALAGLLARLADELRATRLAAAEAAARRAGVLVVLPLGLCFLPAFVLAGLVPVIVAVLGDVL